MKKYEESWIVRIPNAKDPPMRPAKNPPEPEHTSEYYCSVDLIKPLGRRKKHHSWNYRVSHTPWDDINDTELILLCLKNIDLEINMERWRILNRGLTRGIIIRIILGEINTNDLSDNPIHTYRQDLQMLMYENWKNIWSQIGCNTCCWECSDVKVLECVLENYDNLLGDRK
jgi:hypothetical protein